jgi:hypothetical protein
MSRVTARHLAVALGAVLVLAACNSGTNDESGPQATTTTTTPPTATESIRQECVDVADKSRALLTEVGRLTTGDTTIAQVNAAAGELSDAFDAARESVAPDARADLDQAGQALQQVQDALAAQPVDTAALRVAAAELVTTLGDAASVCTPGSPTAPTS